MNAIITLQLPLPNAVFHFAKVSKSKVTHIVASNLTNAKIKEFRYFSLSYQIS